MKVSILGKAYGGQRAIISSIAMHPLFDGQYAAACYGPSSEILFSIKNTEDEKIRL